MKHSACSLSNCCLSSVFCISKIIANTLIYVKYILKDKQSTPTPQAVCSSKCFVCMQVNVMLVHKINFKDYKQKGHKVANKHFFLLKESAPRSNCFIIIKQFGCHFLYFYLVSLHQIIFSVLKSFFYGCLLMALFTLAYTYNELIYHYVDYYYCYF